MNRSAFTLGGGASLGDLPWDQVASILPDSIALGDYAVKSYGLVSPRMIACDQPGQSFLPGNFLSPEVAIYTIARYHDIKIGHVHVQDEGKSPRLFECPNIHFFKDRLGPTPDDFFEGPVYWGDMPEFGKPGVRATIIASFRVLYDLGVRNIFLLGSDCKRGRKFEFAGDDQKTMSEFDYWGLLFDKLEELKPQFDANGLDIFNCNQNSDLTVFPYMSFDDAMAIVIEENQEMVPA